VTTCPFCPPDNVFMEYGSCLAHWDNYPVRFGHALILPRRHVVSYFDLTVIEVLDLHATTAAARSRIGDVLGHDPAGFTIGVNEGLAAGRTVHHLHLHVIPREVGDHPDPRGGIRNIFPNGRLP
jgi:diadenosine tetraphosphate (Ap4A) HIT family hydrolase